MGLFQIVKSYFAQVGIEMEVRPMESNACTAFVQARKHDQLVYRPYGPFGHDYAPFQTMTRFHSDSQSQTGLMVNDPVIDAFYPKAIAATSEDEIKQIMRDMEERVARQHFAISLLQPMEYYPMSAMAEGFSRSNSFDLDGSWRP